MNAPGENARRRLADVDDFVSERGEYESDKEEEEDDDDDDEVLFRGVRGDENELSDGERASGDDVTSTVVPRGVLVAVAVVVVVLAVETDCAVD